MFVQGLGMLLRVGVSVGCHLPNWCSFWTRSRGLKRRFFLCGSRHSNLRDNDDSHVDSNKVNVWFWPFPALHDTPKLVIRAAGPGKSSRSGSVQSTGQDLPLSLAGPGVAIGQNLPLDLPWIFPKPATDERPRSPGK